MCSHSISSPVTKARANSPTRLQWKMRMNRSQTRTVAKVGAAAGAMPAAAPTFATVRVWDRFIRIFHWSLVGLFALAFVTGDEIEWLHIGAGYAIVALVALR